MPKIIAKNRKIKRCPKLPHLSEVKYLWDIFTGHKIIFPMWSLVIFIYLKWKISDN